ncbi:MAG TPA: hypothetical protein VEK85_10905, partial [Gemmatimonadales bacterium]|nr:hypothetical protein [Gemmatimonadales bacterium]
EVLLRRQQRDAGDTPVMLGVSKVAVSSKDEEVSLPHRRPYINRLQNITLPERLGHAYLTVLSEWLIHLASLRSRPVASRAATDIGITPTPCANGRVQDPV